MLEKLRAIRLVEFVYQLRAVSLAEDRDSVDRHLRVLDRADQQSPVALEKVLDILLGEGVAVVLELQADDAVPVDGHESDR